MTAGTRKFFFFYYFIECTLKDSLNSVVLSLSFVPHPKWDINSWFIPLCAPCHSTPHFLLSHFLPPRIVTMKWFRQRWSSILMCWSRKFPYPPQKVLVSAPPHPSGNSSLASYFPLKNSAFETPPSPRNFHYITLPWGGGEWIFFGTAQYILSCHGLLLLTDG